MTLILLAGLNLLLFIILDRRRPASALPSIAERIVAGLSAMLWTAVLFAGRFIGFA